MRPIVKHFKVVAHQGTPDSQNRYGIYLQNGDGSTTDFKGATHYFKPAAHEGIALAQNNYRASRQNSEGAMKESKGIAYYFKLTFAR
jgi:TPR repeat protein